MKLTVNKQEAKLLEDIHIIADKSKVSVKLTEETIKTVGITFTDDKETDINYKMKDILVSYKNGDIYIGIRNAYGNGVKTILFKELEQQLWDNDKNRQETIKKSFKADPKYLNEGE